MLAEREVMYLKANKRIMEIQNISPMQKNRQNKSIIISFLKGKKKSQILLDFYTWFK
jgi:hypothetical protein